jgi:hypothetical protein
MYGGSITGNKQSKPGQAGFPPLDVFIQKFDNRPDGKLIHIGGTIGVIQTGTY